MIISAVESYLAQGKDGELGVTGEGSLLDHAQGKSWYSYLPYIFGHKMGPLLFSMTFRVKLFKTEEALVNLQLNFFQQKISVYLVIKL